MRYHVRVAGFGELFTRNADTLQDARDMANECLTDGYRVSIYRYTPMSGWHRIPHGTPTMTNEDEAFLARADEAIC